MGTTVDVVINGGSHADARWVEDEFERLETRWSRFRPDSELLRCNARAGVGATRVSEETMQAISLACALWRETDGYFDPTVLRAMEASGYDETFERLRERRRDTGFVRTSSAPPGRAPITVLARPVRSVPAPGCAGVILDDATSAVSLPADGTFDLGGLGKGLAADLIGDRLLKRGAEGVALGVGGDISCRGAGPNDGGWDIEVEDPFDAARILFTHRLHDGAIVTSSALMRRWRHGGQDQHHLIDPRTGRPAAGGVAAVIVSDRSAARAEAIAKAALVAGPTVGSALLDRLDVTGWLVIEDGTVVGPPADHGSAVRVA